MIESKIKSTVRDVNDFPKAGIVFKDITPILKDPQLCMEITKALAEQLKDVGIDVVAGIESRGFLFGPVLAQLLNVPFVPIRKAGKLPYKTVQQSYELEYGTATIELPLAAADLWMAPYRQFFGERLDRLDQQLKAMMAARREATKTRKEGHEK